MSEKDIRRWERASAAFGKQPKNLRFLSQILWHEGWTAYPSFDERLLQLPNVQSGELLISRCLNLESRDLEDVWEDAFSGKIRCAGRNMILINLCVFSGSLYGGVHFALWYYPFPTNAEVLLWGGSAVTLVALQWAIMCFLLIKSMWLLIENTVGKRDRSKGVEVLLRTQRRYLVLVAIGVPYPAAQIFLVVKSFISLRHVPLGIYAGVG